MTLQSNPVDQVRSTPRADASVSSGERPAGQAPRVADDGGARRPEQRADRQAPGSDLPASPWASAEGSSSGSDVDSNDRPLAAAGPDRRADASNPEAVHEAVSVGALGLDGVDADGVTADTFEVINFDPSAGLANTGAERMLRVEFAQAAQTGAATDAREGGGILSIPPYQLAVLGLGLGLAVGGAGGGGGGGGGSAESFVWGAGSLNISTPGGTIVTVDASGGASGRLLTLSGASAVNVNGYSGTNSINASNSSGKLSINIVDDGVASRLSLVTGSAETSITSADARDELSIDATALPNTANLIIAGRVAQANISALAGNMSAAGLGSGAVTVSTSAVPAGQQRSISIITGAGATSVAGQPGDTIFIDAEALADNVKLKTSGGARFEIINLMGDLENTATGGVTATLDHDPVPGEILRTSVSSSGAVTIRNGTLDGNDTILLDGVGPFTVTGLIATLDASRATGATTVTSANVGAAEVNVIAGSGATTVNGAATNGKILIDAAAIPDNTALDVRGPGGFTITGLKGNVVADQATGLVSVVTPADSVAQEVSVRLGVAGGLVRASDSVDLIEADALRMGQSSTLTIGGPNVADASRGTVRVASLSGTLDNGSSVNTVATLAEASVGAATVVTVKSESIININNGTLNANDTIKVSGEGVFQIAGLASNVDGLGVTGPGGITATLASDDTLLLSLSPGNADSVTLNGRATKATMVDVETLNVSAGGNISDASITSNATAAAAGRITGTKLDFGDQTDSSKKLTINPDQHADILAGSLVDADQANAGVQTLALSRGATISQTIPNIDIYELSNAGSTFNVVVKTAPASVSATVINDIQQQLGLGTGQTSSALTIKGSAGSDVIRSAAADTMRGGLVVELGADGVADYLFIKNADIGNRNAIGAADFGFGGGLVASTGGDLANYPTLSQTISNHWVSLKARADAGGATVSGGIRAETVGGFSTDTVSGVDKIIYLNGENNVATGAYVSVTQANPAGFSPGKGGIVEIESTYITALLGGANSAAANVGTDPRALDKVATLLATLPAFNDTNGDDLYVILYDYTAQAPNQKADAWLYAAVATQDDGLDFADSPGAIQRDTDTLELIAIFKGVGVNAFTQNNFV